MRGVGVDDCVLKKAPYLYLLLRGCLGCVAGSWVNSDANDRAIVAYLGGVA